MNTRAVISTLLVLGIQSLTAATTLTVDWLGLSGSTLMSDDGSIVGSLQVDVTAGSLLPGFPAGDFIGGTYWTELVPFASGDIGTFAVQAAPTSGVVTWTAKITLLGEREILLGVGQLRSDGTHFTAGVGISANSGTISFLGSAGWNDGFKNYTNPVQWDGSQVSLADSSVAGESEMAFLRVQSSSNITSVNFQIIGAYNQGLGDTIELAIGVPLPIPEPSIAALLVLGCSILFRGRNRVNEHVDLTHLRASTFDPPGKAHV